MKADHYQRMISSAIVQDSRHTCALLGLYLQLPWFILYLQASFSSPLSILTIARHLNIAVTLIPLVFHFFFLCIARNLDYMCSPTTMSVQKSLVTCLNDDWSDKTVFSDGFRSCTPVNITDLIVIGIQLFTEGPMWPVAGSQASSPSKLSTCSSLIEGSHSPSSTSR